MDQCGPVGGRVSRMDTLSLCTQQPDEFKGPLGYSRWEKETYTVFVSFPTSERAMIRVDGNDLKTALLKVLSEYIGLK